MLSQHSKKHHAGAPNIVPDPLVDPGNPPRRYQARSTAHPDRPRSRMVALAASSPGRCSPRSPQTNNATVMLVQFGSGSRRRSMLMPRGRRSSTAAFTSGGARNASESVRLIWRTVHRSRFANCSASVIEPVMISSSHRRPCTIALISPLHAVRPDVLSECCGRQKDFSGFEGIFCPGDQQVLRLRGAAQRL